MIDIHGNEITEVEKYKQAYPFTVWKKLEGGTYGFQLAATCEEADELLKKHPGAQIRATNMCEASFVLAQSRRRN